MTRGSIFIGYTNTYKIVLMAKILSEENGGQAIKRIYSNRQPIAEERLATKLDTDRSKFHRQTNQ